MGKQIILTYHERQHSHNKNRAHFLWDILHCCHYSDVIMSMIASQIYCLTIVYLTVYWDADQRKHQSSASLAFVRGIHRGPVNSPHKWPVTRKMFPFDDVIMRSCVVPEPAELSQVKPKGFDRVTSYKDSCLQWQPIIVISLHTHHMNYKRHQTKFVNVPSGPYYIGILLSRPAALSVKL